MKAMESRMTELVIQSWSKPTDRAGSWVLEEQQVRHALGDLGIEIVQLKPGSGLIRFDQGRLGSVQRAKDTIQTALPPSWRVYETSRSSLP